MRAGLATIQQTLTPEAAAVLNRSIAEAGRRNHGQTTPLHVAATLLSSPTGLLRQACLRSHPASSHPLQCRALELCFSVALDRLPSNPPPTTATTAANSSIVDPPISNALMAALKRAQAHQRRGCPESQQQPLLAVKVELEQLVVSILDDPGVSRVMREASFSSPAVKATIEQSLSSNSTAAAATTPSAITTSPSAAGTPSKNIYINPRLHQQSQFNGAADGHRRDDVKRVVDILLRSKKRSPILVGDSDPAAVMREVLQRIERRELGPDSPPHLSTARVVSLAKELATVTDRSQIPAKIKDLGDSIETQIGGGAVVVDLGDLKWLVEAPGATSGSAAPVPIQQQQAISEIGRAAVAEMGRILRRFTDDGGGDGSNRVRLVGTAGCATYLRCQVYHPTMESDWDLQAVPIAPRSPLPGLFPRMGSSGILSSSVESLATPAAKPKGFTALAGTGMSLRRAAESADPAHKTTMCLICTESYEQELAKLVAKQFEKSSADFKPEARPALPQWLQIAAPCAAAKPASNQPQSKEQEIAWKQSTKELLKRWQDTCSRIHPNFQLAAMNSGRSPASSLQMQSSYSSAAPSRQPFHPKLALSQSTSPMQTSSYLSPVLNSSDCPASRPGSPVKTDLVLGRPKVSNEATAEKTHSEQRLKDLTGGFMKDYPKDKISGISDIESFKKIFTGLNEKVGWQPEAASAVATVVMQCKNGKGKHRGAMPKGDTWLLFIGPDKVGKKRMAAALSELVVGTCPVTVHLGQNRSDADDGESDMNYRGKTAVDKVAEAVQRNPFSVIVLEDIDQADMLVRGTIKRAMERGRLPDSYGREISLGSVIFVLTAKWLPEELRSSQDSLVRSEEKILDAANSGWQLELSVGERPGKRRGEWHCEDDRFMRPRKEPSVSLDLNLAAGVDDEAGEGSRNSSDLTVELEHEHRRLAIRWPASSASELINSVDEAIMFKPVDFGPLRRKVSDSISEKFTAAMGGGGRSLQVDDDVLDQIVGGIWLSGAATKLEEWTERVLIPSIHQLKNHLSADTAGPAVRLSSNKSHGQPQRSNGGGDLLPGMVGIAVDGLGA